MNWAKKGAMWTLVVAVLLTAMPATACLLAPRTAGLPACCRAMAKECTTPGTSMNASCCQFDRKDAAAVPSSLFSSEHQQKKVQALHPAALDLSAAPPPVSSSAFNAPPPKTPLGDISVLRI